MFKIFMLHCYSMNGLRCQFLHGLYLVQTNRAYKKNRSVNINVMKFNLIEIKNRRSIIFKSLKIAKSEEMYKFFIVVQLCFETSRIFNLLFDRLLEVVSSFQDLVDSGQISEVLNITNQTEIDEFKKQIDMLDKYITVAFGKE